MGKTIKSVLVALIAVAATMSAAPTAQATNIGEEGCTPGYWKNHTDNWEEANPGTKFGDKFEQARANVAGQTFLQTLQGGGGPGLDGAAKILARAATAAFLNAAHEGLGYPWRRDQVGIDGRPPLKDAVNAAFASNNRDTMLALADRLDDDNNLGCPLN